MFLISTPQRCGSTWLAKMLCGMAQSRELYVNGVRMGFGIGVPSEPDAIAKLGRFFARHPRVAVFKTHDVPARDFDAVCAAFPELRILTLHRDFRDTLVSRYFYLRYYWRTDLSLGPLPRAFREFFRSVGEIPDREALAALAAAPLARGWAREWAAFEGSFTTPRALRLSFTGMLDESDFPRIAAFTGLPLRKRRPFRVEQAQETESSGREGVARFHRNGRAGEWREWFSEEDGARLAEYAREAAEKQRHLGR